jgi:hypothetical protein
MAVTNVVTGILDRLQHDGWIISDGNPDASDRRSVAVRALRGATRNSSVSILR